MYFKTLFLLTTLKLVWTQRSSPCPDVLTYEENDNEPDRWYGNLKLSSDVPLLGIWLRIILDQPADILANWFGETMTLNNKEFIITNRNYELQPNEPLSLRFFVKHKTKSPIIKEITLNGETICTLEKPPVRFQSNSGVNEAILEQNPLISIKDECGTIKVAGQPLITSGEATFEGEWPWHVAVYRSKALTVQYVCGGTLISDRHVLTSANCVTQTKTKEPFDTDLFIIYLGRHSLHRATSNAQNKKVQGITIHPDYNPTYYYNNLAVVKLESPAEITDFVRPICLWDGDNNLKNILGKAGTIVGWGYNENATLTENLMQALMPIVDTPTCIFSNRSFFSLFTSPTTYCAGFKNGTSACIGDNGGGMVFPKEVDGHVNWQLRGIISVTAAVKTKIVCDTASYTVFTDVAKHLDWIKNIIKK